MMGASSLKAVAMNMVASCAVIGSFAQPGLAEFADNRSLMFIFDQCKDSHPTFDRIAESANAYGFDRVEVSPGLVRYNNPVEHPNSFLEVKSLENGASHCIAYNANVAVDTAIADFNLLRLPQMKFGTPTQTTIANTSLAYHFDGMLYDLWTSILPLPDGGSAIVIQVANASEQTAQDVTLNGQEINWRPSGGVPTSDFRIGFGFFCMTAMPKFENSVPSMVNTGASATPTETGQSVQWPDVGMSFYLESATAAKPGKCQVSSTGVTLAEINNIGRTQFSDFGVEEDQPDGTRVWRFQNGAFGATDTIAYTFQIPGSQMFGLALQMSDFDPNY